MKRLLFVVLGLSVMCFMQASAQISSGGTPVSFTRSAKTSIQSITTASVDRQALLAEDEIEQATKDVPYRFGFPFDVHYNLSNSGTWETLPDGTRMWRLRIESKGAYSINLIYDDFWLPEGAKFFVYNADRSMVLGAFTNKNNKDHGKFSTGLVKGDVCILEYTEPKGVKAPGRLSIERIVHGYRNLFNWPTMEQALRYSGDYSEATDFGGSGSCNNNVNCPEGDPWQNQTHAVAMILSSGGFRLCSGSMINNVRQDRTPYFLTANHCAGGEATWIIMFNYESPTCANIDGPTWMTISGTTKRASRSFSDFMLLELSSQPPDSYNVYYAGWNAIDTPSDSVIGIHHPAGDIKKISFDYDATTSTSYLGTSVPGDNSHWRIGQWEDGTTEPGSSGSPIFNRQGQIIGQLHGGYASCSSITSDYYGKVSRSWADGGTPSTQLKDWLDPDNTGVLQLGGLGGSGVKITHTPLLDTRDTAVDYEVLATIVSDTTLVANALLLTYEINAVQTSATLLPTGNPDEFNAFIPAQSPGTIVSYFLTALDDAGATDTAGLFTFSVADNYEMSLLPLSQSQYGPAGNDAIFLLTIHNLGLQNDTYDLVSSGGTWTVSFFDATGTTPITSVGPVVATDSAQFVVKIAVPPGTPMLASDVSTITVTSQGDPLISANAQVTALSAGTPGGFPWYESFPTNSLNSNRWMTNIGGVVSDSGVAPPSSPYSLNLDGGNDTVVTQLIDVSGQTGVIVSYYYELGGASEPPDAGDDLELWYLNNVGSWVLLQTHLGSGATMSNFEFVSVGLPADGLHAGLQLRFTTVGSCIDCDNWFVDDIRVDFAPEISVTSPSYSFTLPVEDSTTDVMTIDNIGLGGLSYSLSVTSVTTPKRTLVEELIKNGQAEPARRKYDEGILDYNDFKGSDAPFAGYPVTKSAGGPDTYGYVWIDSDEPGGPIFAWQDVSTTGTDIVAGLADDNYIGPYDLGFPFSFYDSTYTQVYIGSNGIIGFDSVGMNSRFKTSLPSATTPNNLIAWLWDDLNPTDADNPNAHVYIDTTGGRCVIQFVDYAEYAAAAGEVVNAEVILYPDGRITYQYLTIAPGFDIANNTIGLENADGTDGIEVSYLTTYLHDNLAIDFLPPAQWLSLDITSGSLVSGTSETITMGVKSVGLDTGYYQAEIVVTSNDPTNGQVIIPVDLTVNPVSTYICGDINGSGALPITVDDLTYLVAFLFQAGPPPPEIASADCNGSGGIINVDDLTYLVAYLFQSGPPPICGT